MKTLYHFLYISVICLCFGYVIYLQSELSYALDSVDDLYSKNIELESNIEELKDKLETLSENSDDNLSYYEAKINLQERELYLDKNRILEQDIFYEFIKGTEYEDYIVGTTNTNHNRPEFNKVKVSITGTSEIISYLQHISGKSNLYYIQYYYR